MNIPRVLFIVLFFGLYSCEEIRENEKITEVDKDSTAITHKFVQISKKINDKSSGEFEYILTKKDSFLNQARIYNNGILDTMKSRFYDLKITQNDGLNHSGHIYYRNYLDTLGLEINEERFIFLYLQQQISEDSIAHKIFVSEDGNNIYYKYSDFKNGLISGYIQDTALDPLSQKDSIDDDQVVRYLEQPMNIQKRIKINKENVLQHRL